MKYFKCKKNMFYISIVDAQLVYLQLFNSLIVFSSSSDKTDSTIGNSTQVRKDDEIEQRQRVHRRQKNCMGKS